MNTTPYWRKLLQHQVKIGKTGLSIPFLIGAKKFTKNPNLLSIKELFKEIINYKDVSALYFCENPLKEFTITIYPALINVPKEYYKFKKGNLIIPNIEKLNGINEIEDLIETLKIYYQYQKNIDNSKFDKNNGKWSDFTDESIEFIKKCLQ